MTAIESEYPADDDFATQILARRRKRLPLLTALLCLAVIVGAAFAGGALVQKHWGGTSSASSSGATAARAFRNFAGRAPGATFFGGGGGGGSAATTGTVTLIKGSSLYVTDATGNTVIVHTSAASRVTKTVGASVKTIHPGDSVTVTGPQRKDGSYTGSAIAVTSG
jgi:hypothetical protein